MKNRHAVVLTLALCLALLVPTQAAAQSGGTFAAIATNNTIVVSNSADQPDAHVVNPAVYKIGGENYFKLRDLAMLLNGSGRQFAVNYDDALKLVSIAPGAPYRAIGGELSGAAAEHSSANPSNDAFMIDGSPAPLTVFKIDGANYFRLRDLGKALDFHVGYDDETKTVFISGARGYEEETGPARRDGERFEAVIVLEGMEETVRYEHVRNETLGFELDYEYELLERRGEADHPYFVSRWDDPGDPWNYLEIAGVAANADAAAAAVQSALSLQFGAVVAEECVLDRAGRCVRLDASDAKSRPAESGEPGAGTETARPGSLRTVYVIPASDGCLIATAHCTVESAEGFGARFSAIMNTLSIIGR